MKKVLAFGWKYFSSIEKWDSTPFRQTFGSDNLDLTSGFSVRSMMSLILVKKDFNYFNFYNIDVAVL